MQKCCQEHPRFADLVKEIKCPSTPDQQHISEILHKPINRMQRNSLVLLVSRSTVLVLLECLAILFEIPTKLEAHLSESACDYPKTGVIIVG